MPNAVSYDGFPSYFDDWEAEIGAFLECDRGLLFDVEKKYRSGEGAKSSALKALPFAVKDNIAVKDFRLSCGSKLLESFRAPYTATAVERLQAAGAIVVGKTNLDEFGMGSSCDNSALKRTNNPWDTERVPGGSSGGSAAAVAAGLVPFALGSDTGGSVRQPAAFCGVYGLKPSYGAVSRFGLTAYASSLELIGIIADTAARTRAVFNIMRGPDPLDQSSVESPRNAPELDIPANEPSIIGIPNFPEGSMDRPTESAYKLCQQRLASLGHTLVPVELPPLDYAAAAYYVIAMAEASANLARFDGIRYGQRPKASSDKDELINKARGEGLGKEVKLRILLGTFVLRSGFQDRYYLRAQRIRKNIRFAYNQLWRREPNKSIVEDETRAGLDALLLPVFPTQAFPRGQGGLSSFQQKTADLFTCVANLTGLPALAFPASLVNGLPLGFQLMGPSFSEGRLLAIAEGYERAYQSERPKGFRAFWS